MDQGDTANLAVLGGNLPPSSATASVRTFASASTTGQIASITPANWAKPADMQSQLAA